MSIYLAMGIDEFKALPDYNTHYFTLLGLWRAAQDNLSTAKEEEMHYRMLLARVTFGDDPKEGTTSHVFGDPKDKKAAKLTISAKINRSIDEAAIGHVLATLRETIGPVADTVVRYKPELSITAWRELTDTQKEILAPAITAKPGTPSLKFVDAK